MRCARAFNLSVVLALCYFTESIVAQSPWQQRSQPVQSSWQQRSQPQPAQQQANEPQHVCVDLTARFSSVEGTDGVRKEIITLNDRFPGPTIRAKLGDKLTVTVRNQLRSASGREEETSVHFHGLEMKETPWWDGPELVTQCPIQYGGHMTYTFNLHQVGTYWYHSHTSYQYIDGFWGFLIIDSNVTDVQPHRYDDELTISLMDWHHRTGAELTQVFRLPETSSILNAARTPVADSALINGRGNANCSLARSQNFTCNDALASMATVFNVNPGWTYRIRVLNPSARASFNFSLDNLKLRVIEVDGVDTEEVAAVDAVEIFPAQRYSFLVTMDSKLPLDYFWIRADMVLEALTPAETIRVRNIRPLAAIRYVRQVPNQQQSWACTPSSPSPAAASSSVHGSRGGGFQGRPACRQEPWMDGRVQWAKSRFEAFPSASSISTCTTPTDNTDPLQVSVDQRCIPDLSRRTPNPVYLNQMDCQPLPSSCDTDVVPEMFDNEVTLTARITTDALGFNRWEFSNVSYNTENEHVPAIFHVLAPKRVPRPFGPQYVPFLKNIQVVINNDNVASHPYHLHGHTFWVMATGAPGQGNYNSRRDGWRLQNSRPIKRDTTHAFPRSWTVIRFCTDNPGAWLLHCHIHWHLDRGLGAVFVEGEEEVPCRYEVPEEARRVCEDNGILIRSGRDACRRQNPVSRSQRPTSAQSSRQNHTARFAVRPAPRTATQADNDAFNQLQSQSQPFGSRIQTQQPQQILSQFPTQVFQQQPGIEWPDWALGLEWGRRTGRG